MPRIRCATTIGPKSKAVLLNQQYQIDAIEFIPAAACAQLIESNTMLAILFHIFNGGPAIVFIRGAVSHMIGSERNRGYFCSEPKQGKLLGLIVNGP